MQWRNNAAADDVTTLAAQAAQQSEYRALTNAPLHALKRPARAAIIARLAVFNRYP